jgi:hypothetical protein
MLNEPHMKASSEQQPDTISQSEIQAGFGAHPALHIISALRLFA